MEARNASLARLRRCGQELDGGIVAIDTSTSCVLVDLEHHRFGCITLESDVDTQVTLGRWHRFDDIWCDGGDIVIAPSANVAPIRIHPRTGGVT